MYILIVSLLLLGVLFYCLDIETNITIVSLVIIILLLTSLFNKNSYEKFNISKLQDLHLSSINEIEKLFNEKLDIIGENNYPKISITNSKFNENLSKKECKCPKLSINQKQLSNKEFINLIEKIKSRE